MQYHDDRHPVFPVQFLHKLQNLNLITDIQIRRRLIEEKRLRALCQRHRDPDSLSLTAGQTGKLPVTILCNIRNFHRPLDIFLVLFLMRAHQSQMRCTPKRDQPLDRNIVRSGIVLMNDCNLPRKFIQSEIIDIFSFQKDLPFSRYKILRHQREQSRFTASVRAHDRRDSTFFDRQRRPFQNLILPVGKMNIPYFHRRLLLAFPRVRSSVFSIISFSEISETFNFPGLCTAFSSLAESDSRHPFLKFSLHIFWTSLRE